jgi:predicted nucleic acid-binding protein
MLKIYLDTNVWCRPFDAPSKRVVKETNAFLKILEMTYEGRFNISGSIISDIEIDRIDGEEKRKAIRQLIPLFISEKEYEISEILLKEIKSTIHLSLPDSAHLACAIKQKCKYFLTCDDELLMKKEEIERNYQIKVRNPINFLLEEETW